MIATMVWDVVVVPLEIHVGRIVNAGLSLLEVKSFNECIILLILCYCRGCISSVLFFILAQTKLI
jgi:hypothetical protein